MSSRKTTLGEHSDLARRLLQVLEDFIDEIGRRNCTAHFESVIGDGKYMKGKKLGQKPERFIEDHLIFPVVRELGHTLRPQPVQYAPQWPKQSGIPDFSLTTITTEVAKDSGIRLFGESKTPNKLNYARSDVEEYLNKDLDFHAVALLTDGIEWELWLRERNEPLQAQHTPVRQASLLDVLNQVKARNIADETYQSHSVRQTVPVEAFEEFTESAVRRILDSELEFELSE